LQAARAAYETKLSVVLPGFYLEVAL